jgi:hypothetical protein
MTFLGLIISLYLMENGVTRHVVADDVLDECLHDLLIDLLEERDIFNEFVEKLSVFSTAYERSLFISLLECTKKSVSSIRRYLCMINNRQIIHT